MPEKSKPKDATAGTDPGADAGNDGEPTPVDDFRVVLDPLEPDRGYQQEDIDRLTHNENMGGYASWNEQAQWHARRQERLTHRLLTQTLEHYGGSIRDEQGMQGVRSAVESLWHFLASIQAGTPRGQHAHYDEAP